MYRVRELTDRRLDYHRHVNSGEIPEGLFVEPVAPKRLPPWVYKSACYTHHGLFWELLIYKMLQGVAVCEGSPWGYDDDNILLAEHVADFHNPRHHWRIALDTCFQLAFHQKTLVEVPTLRPASYGKFESVLRTYLGGKTCLFGQEIGAGPIRGHPDIYVPDFIDGDGLILDVKTTQNFEAMRADTIKQLLAYVALLRAQGEDRSARYIGVVLPLQRQILLFDLENWHYQPFLQVLENCMNPVIRNREIEEVEALTLYAGHHTSKEKLLLPSLQGYYSHNPFQRPMQMFLRSPRGRSKCAHDDDDHEPTHYHALPYSDADMIAAREYITAHNITYFTHAPYFVNLAKPYNSQTVTRKETESWSLRVLVDDLAVTSRMGGSGVVVHVGKALEQSEDAAYAMMVASVKAVLPYATAMCPLLIETPAGQGSELLTRFSSLVAFWREFTPEEQTKLGICVDTCHVFATGYYPHSYLARLGEEIGWSNIRLIHLNDSAKELNCRVDNHANLGTGCIGWYLLGEVARLCNRHRIPMVQE